MERNGARDGTGPAVRPEQLPACVPQPPDLRIETIPLEPSLRDLIVSRHVVLVDLLKSDRDEAACGQPDHTLHIGVHFRIARWPLDTEVAACVHVAVRSDRNA